MDVVRDIIAFKRDGGELDEEKLAAFVRGVVDGSIATYQASALLMAIVLRGFSRGETIALAHAMVASGKTLDLSAVRRPVLDKHSSGGVGDKVTLALAPLVAACGGVFGKMSGRGLGHTGGTLDKLESIPGFRVQLSQGEFLHQLERIGVAVTAQSERIVPADRILYALRDVTATVENDGLIAASIMAKKIATGTAAIVLDLKVGRGAFMARPRAGAGPRRAVRRRRRLVRAAGHLVLHRHGRAARPRRRQPARGRGGLAGAERRRTARRARARAHARRRAARPLGPGSDRGGRASARGARARPGRRGGGRSSAGAPRRAATWRRGDGHHLGAAEVRAERGGYVTEVDALLVGQAAQAAGAGRQRVDDVIDHAAGVVLAHKPGDAVENGELLATAYARETARRRAAGALLAQAFNVGDEAPEPAPLVLGRTRHEAASGVDGE